ncbi:DNA-binding HxlR family transcriptional regulator [Crossiella equi]|uniref:DNA-binding HxlR family transcriptional regulator n=1 Tax=Crossiella equi TaxID=130796 RepID=A0ABS5ABL8_9PSEU|nr:helix-turn-helix domain-containing protein [Crossiella equi]MBP2473682.1 DNA-binding HxlR family transcriptional regulator [Crossiella equi]
MATQTVRQQRLAARAAYDAFLAACPARNLLDRIADKWVTLLMGALATGPMRYSELSRRLAGISQKMLTQTLRAMERDGLVTREVTPSVPVRVDYALTPLGVSLHQVVRQLKLWAEANMDEVYSANEDYDRRAASHQD